MKTATKTGTNLNAIVLSLLGLASLSVIVSCGAKTDTASSSTTFTAVYAVINNQSCSQCHQPGGSATTSGTPLDFTTQANAYSGLTTKSSTGTVASACNGVPLAVSSNPTGSYLLAVLFADYASNTFGKAGCTPYYNTHNAHFSLSSSDEAEFVSWINGGRKND
jgi:hypothetical protein